MPQNSEQIESKLCAYIEGELDDKERLDIEKHLQANPHHRSLLAELAETRRLMRALPRESAPAELAEQFQGQLERAVLLDDSTDDAERSAFRINRWPQYAAAAAIIVLAVGLGLVVYFALPTLNNTPVNVAYGPDDEPEKDPQQTQERKPGVTESGRPIQKDAEAENRLARGQTAATAPVSDGVTPTPEAGESVPERLPDLAQKVRGAASPDESGELFGDGPKRPAGSGGQGASQAAPVVLVVSAANPRATGVELEQMLDAMADVRWSDATESARLSEKADGDPNQVQALLEQARLVLQQEGQASGEDSLEQLLQQQQGQRFARPGSVAGTNPGGQEERALSPSELNSVERQDRVAPASRSREGANDPSAPQGETEDPSAASTRGARAQAKQEAAVTESEDPAAPLADHLANAEEEAEALDATATDDEAAPPPAPSGLALGKQQDEYGNVYRVLVAANVPRSVASELCQKLNTSDDISPRNIAVYGLSAPDAERKAASEPHAEDFAKEKMTQARRPALAPNDPIQPGEDLRIYITPQTSPEADAAEAAPHTARVGDDGTIELPQVEDTIHSEGISPDELERHIESELQKNSEDDGAAEAAKPSFEVRVERLPQPGAAPAGAEDGVDALGAARAEDAPAAIEDDEAAEQREEIAREEAVARELEEAPDRDANHRRLTRRADEKITPTEPAGPADLAAPDPSADFDQAAEDRVNVVIVLRRQAVPTAPAELADANDAAPPVSAPADAAVADGAVAEADDADAAPAERASRGAGVAAPGAPDDTAVADAGDADAGDDAVAGNADPGAPDAGVSDAGAQDDPAVADAGDAGAGTGGAEERMADNRSIAGESSAAKEGAGAGEKPVTARPDATDRAAAGEAPAAPESSKGRSRVERAGAEVIQESDILTVIVTPPADAAGKVTPKQQNVRVGEDGTIEAMQLGRVKALGRTPRQVEAGLVAKMRKQPEKYKSGTRVRVVRQSKDVPAADELEQ